MRLPLFIAVVVLLVLVTFLLDYRVGLPLVLLAPYWLGPVVVRLTARYSRTPVFAPFRPGLDPAPEGARLHLGLVENVLRGEGFVPVAYLSQTGFATNVTAYLAVLEHPRERVLALAAAMVASGAPGATRQVTFTELVTRLGDGDHRGLTTNNSTQPTAFAPVPGRTLHRLPGERDLRRLLRVHRALVARAGVPPAPSRLADVGPERLLAESTAREMAAQVAAGYLVAAGDHYRPTWRGAFTMTWRLLWPIKSLRESQVRRRAAALLRELGV